jgi:Response regulator containing CheY-like receiver domain and AraC-type DNA-binding domain
MRCTSAASDDEALQFLCEAIADDDPYALAIIDMEMPGMNGMELARAIKCDLIAKDIRVVMLCSDAKARKNSDIDAFLVKPVKQPQLHQCLVKCSGAAPLKRTKAKNQARPTQPLVLFMIRASWLLKTMK